MSTARRTLRRCAIRIGAFAVVFAAACAGRTHGVPQSLAGFAPVAGDGESIRVLDIYPGVTATIVAPRRVDVTAPVELILYALPNGNSTAETMGRAMADSVGWRHDIQHIAAQTRALRAHGVPQAIVAYLEADGKSWPAWRAKLGYERANRRIVEIADQLRVTIGSPPHLSLTLTGHSGGGSFMFGFIEGWDTLPAWLDRIAFLDANYSFTPAHGDKLTVWLRGDPRRRLVVLAYDDREIMLDGKKVVSDSGGTWRATQRMIDYFSRSDALATDSLGPFIRSRATQIELLRHPNPANAILHTAMIGDMNGYLHAMLTGRAGYNDGVSVLSPSRVYTPFIEGPVPLPPAVPPEIPPRAAGALTGSAFIESVAHAARDDREVAVRRELLAGNVPSFLRTLRRVEARAVGADGVAHIVTYEVMPDYLAIGSDEDFLRMPMTPYTAQAFGDAFGFVLPTRKMVNDIWAAAPVHVEPRPLTQNRDSALTFLQHQRIIEEQLAGQPRGVFVAGIKKDVVVSNTLLTRSNRVAIYGWHYMNGEPIQPVYAGHVDWYVDYSHGIRPVRRGMWVDGRRTTFEAILADSTVRALLSDEGALAVTRYPTP